MDEEREAFNVEFLRMVGDLDLDDGRVPPPQLTFEERRAWEAEERASLDRLVATGKLTPTEAADIYLGVKYLTDNDQQKEPY